MTEGSVVLWTSHSEHRSHKVTPGEYVATVSGKIVICGRRTEEDSQVVHHAGNTGTIRVLAARPKQPRRGRVRQEDSALQLQRGLARLRGQEGATQAGEGAGAEELLPAPRHTRPLRP